MPQKPDIGWKIFAGLAGMASAYAVRKTIEISWKKGTGKEPPMNPEDPNVRLSEALGWAVVMGVGLEVTRVLVSRAAVKQWESSTGALPAHLLKDLKDLKD